jgi:hypothetical protein
VAQLATAVEELRGKISMMHYGINSHRSKTIMTQSNLNGVRANKMKSEMSKARKNRGQKTSGPIMVGDDAFKKIKLHFMTMVESLDQTSPFWHEDSTRDLEHEKLKSSFERLHKELDAAMRLMITCDYSSKLRILEAQTKCKLAGYKDWFAAAL